MMNYHLDTIWFRQVIMTDLKTGGFSLFVSFKLLFLTWRGNALIVEWILISNCLHQTKGSCIVTLEHHNSRGPLTNRLNIFVFYPIFRETYSPKLAMIIVPKCIVGSSWNLFLWCHNHVCHHLHQCNLTCLADILTIIRQYFIVQSIGFDLTVINVIILQTLCTLMVGVSKANRSAPVLLRLEANLIQWFWNKSLVNIISLKVSPMCLIGDKWALA